MTPRERGRGILGSLVVLLLAACGGPDLGAPEYPLESCARLEIIDAETGWNVVGAEDFAYGREPQLIISAYDRTIPLREQVAEGRHGQIYALALADIAPGRTELAGLLDATEFGGVLFPHGIDTSSVTNAPPEPETVFIVLDANGDRPDGAAPSDADRQPLVECENPTRFVRRAPGLYFINRSPKNGYHEARLHALNLETGQQTYPFFVGCEPDFAPTAGVKVHPNTNDITVSGAIYATVDRTGSVWRSDVFGLKTGEIHELSVSSVALAGGFAFPNGIIDSVGPHYTDYMIAETRANRLIEVVPRGLKPDLIPFAIDRVYPLPGSPDNLMRGSDGSILAALHPSLFKLGLHRKFGAKHAPSRAVRVDPETGAWTLLFDDPTGKVFTGATVAAEIDGKLVLGSATDRGLLICEKPQ